MFDCFTLRIASRTIRARLAALWLAVVLGMGTAFGAEVMPPKPARYFNDYAGVVPAAVGEQLNRQLKDFEQATSSQIVVAVFSKMQSGSALEDYTRRVALSWGVGQADRKNGAVLFVFVQDRRLRIEVGYGLEGVLPDALCKRIIEEQIKPRFKQGDYGGGVTAGVTALLQATRGEYRGTGSTVGQRGRGKRFPFIPWIFPLLFPLLIPMVLGAVLRGRANQLGSGVVYNRARRSSWIDPGIGFWGGGGGGGASGGGGGGGSFGGFSGGGGDFGGGGASGSW